jgi:hypothetical protein
MLTKAFPRMGGALVNQARANMAEVSYGHLYVVDAILALNVLVFPSNMARLTPLSPRA